MPIHPPSDITNLDDQAMWRDLTRLHEDRPSSFVAIASRMLRELKGPESDRMTPIGEVAANPSMPWNMISSTLAGQQEEAADMEPPTGMDLLIDLIVEKLFRAGQIPGSKRNARILVRAAISQADRNVMGHITGFYHEWDGECSDRSSCPICMGMLSDEEIQQVKSGDFGPWARARQAMGGRTNA